MIYGQGALWRDDIQAWPRVVEVLDARFGAGQWRLCGEFRRPLPVIISAPPIGETYILTIEAPGLPRNVPGGTQIAVILEPSTRSSHPATPIPETPPARCAVCGAPATSNYPAKQRRRPDGPGWFVAYACRTHADQVRAASFDERGHLRFEQSL